MTEQVLPNIAVSQNKIQNAKEKARRKPHLCLGMTAAMTPTTNRKKKTPPPTGANTSQSCRKVRQVIQLEPHQRIASKQCK